MSAQAWAFVTATIALVATLISVLFQLLPELKPDPRERVGADVEVFRVEPGVTVGTWLRRAFSGGAYRRQLKAYLGNSPDPAERNFHGELVYVRTTVDGFKHKRVFLRLRLYNARRQTPLQLPPEFAKIANARLKIDAPSRRSVQLLWIPDLTDEEPAFIRVELLDDQGVLAVGDSAVLKRGRIPQER